MANDVVAEIAGESTAEAWQPEFGGGTVAPQKGSDELEWIAIDEPRARMRIFAGNPMNE